MHFSFVCLLLALTYMCEAQSLISNSLYICYPLDGKLLTGLEMWVRQCPFDGTNDYISSIGRLGDGVTNEGYFQYFPGYMDDSECIQAL